MPEDDDDSTREPDPPVKAVVCGACGTRMRFEEGSITHDLYAEKFVCPACGRVEYQSYGRGSV